MEREEMSRLLLRARGMAVLRGVLAPPVSKDFLALLGLLALGRPDPAAVAETFGRLWEELALEREPLLPDAWRSHLVGRLLDDENAFSLAAERGEMNSALAEQTSRDLRTLQRLFDLEAEPLLNVVEDVVPGLEGVWVPWTNAGGGGLGTLRGAARGSLLAPRRGSLRAAPGVPLGRERPQGGGRARPRAPRRPRRIREGAGAVAHEHRALPRRPPDAPRAPLRHAGDGEVLHSQGRPQRVCRQGVAARRGGEGGPRGAAAGAGESARPRATLRHLRGRSVVRGE